MERDVLDAVFNHLSPERRDVPAGFSPDALLAGAGDAYFCYVTNQPVVFKDVHLKQGKDFLVAHGQLQLPRPFAIVGSRSKAPDGRTPDLRRFSAHLLQGYIDNKKDPSYGAGLAVSKYGRDLRFTLHLQTRLNQLQLELEKTR
jgi:hypothetical protein